MFENDTCLRHLLRPKHYVDPAHYQLEIEKLFVPSWQFACTKPELPNQGDFVTLELLGHPVMVRNCGDEIRAFRNVCPHRHSILTCESSGNMPTIRCQYHGWEFNDEGRTGRIPEARAFRPWDRENSCLTRLRTETCGDLIFVSFGDSSVVPSFREWIHPFFDDVEESFSAPMWRMARSWEYECECNWKVPTENTLESYHISEVHPDWFGGALPEEEGSHHTLEDRYSTLEYRSNFPLIKQTAWVSGLLGREPRRDYRHWQIHPNLTLCMTDTFNYVSTVQPLSPVRCVVRTRMYPLHGVARTPWKKLVRRINWRESKVFQA